MARVRSLGWYMILGFQNLCLIWLTSSVCVDIFALLARVHVAFWG